MLLVGNHFCYTFSVGFQILIIIFFPRGRSWRNTTFSLLIRQHINNSIPLETHKAFVIAKIVFPLSCELPVWKTYRKTRGKFSPLPIY